MGKDLAGTEERDETRAQASKSDAQKLVYPIRNDHISALLKKKEEELPEVPINRYLEELVKRALVVLDAHMEKGTGWQSIDCAKAIIGRGLPMKFEKEERRIDFADLLKMYESICGKRKELKTQTTIAGVIDVKPEEGR